MPNKTIINFGKNKLTAEVINTATHEVTINDKSDIFTQLKSLAHDKKLKLDIKKLDRSHQTDIYPYIMENKENQIVVNFEDKEDSYYKKFDKIYLEQKIKKEKKARNIKVFATYTATTLITASMIAGVVHLAVEAWDKEYDHNLEQGKEHHQMMEAGKANDEIIINPSKIK